MTKREAILMEAIDEIEQKVNDDRYSDGLKVFAIKARVEQVMGKLGDDSDDDEVET